MKMKALKIAQKDLQVFFKDRGSILQLIVVPLVFVIVFSGALTAIGTDEDDRLPLAVVNNDQNQAAQTLLDGIEATGGLRVEYYEQDEAMALLKTNDIHRVLIIPANFTADLEAQKSVILQLIHHPDADREQSEAVRLVVDGIAQDMALKSQIITSLEMMGQMQANSPDSFQVFSTDKIINQAQNQFERARSEPLVSIEEKIPGQSDQEEVEIQELSTVPGIAVLAVFLTAQAAAQMIYEEKKIGAFRRLLAAPVSKTEILLGKMIPNVIIALIQIAVIFAFGAFGLELLGLQPMPLGNDPLALFVVSFIVAVCSSCLAILIAAIARTESQVGGISTLLLWVLAILGGSIIPLFFLESFLGSLPKFIPHYWANRAFDDILIRGLGITEIPLEMGMLLLFAAIFFAIGVWRFEFK